MNIKKGLLSLVLSVISVMAFAQIQNAPEWTTILSNQPETFRTQLVSSSEESIKVKVQVPGFYTTNVTTPKGEAKIVSLPKSVSTAHAGEPNVPMTGIPVMIGDKARMSVRVIEAQYMDFESIEVAPSKGDFPRTIDPATVPYTYGECYNENAFFPNSNLDLYEPYILRDFRGQNMAVYPFAYNPVTKTLRVYYDMTVEMYKVDNNGVNTFQTRRSNTIKMDPDFKSVYQRHFINYEAGMAKYTPLDEEGDLLIICYDNYMSYMTDFVNWKKTRGINTTIVGTTTAGSTYSAIKTYIQNQYNANNNITHVLLVGDVAQIPGYTYSGGGSSYSGKGDNAYGQIVGSDIYNDVIIGRFSASSTARVTTQCQRAITYERDLTTSATWLKIAEGISRKENGSGHNSEDDYQHMNNIRTDLLNYGYSTVYQRYANLTGYDASSSTISSDINSGVGIVNYANHGQETAWGANSSGYVYYSNSHVNALTNENKLPFIFSVACLVGKYDHSSDCFAEAWMNATNNNNPTGAIGTLMSYISQPWIPPMWAQDECIDIIVGSGTASNMHTFGGISINGLMGIFDHYSTSSSDAVGTYQAWIVYGDPSLMVRTKTPEAMTVTHDGSIAPSASSYSVTVSNGSGAVATITDANHNILGKATVSGTTANISLSGATLTAGTALTLCVFGYNKVTYLGTINVVSSGTQYTISASASPTAGGTVTGAGTYSENSTCTLTATANTGYTFSKWTKNGTQVSTNATYSFTVTANANYVAVFTQNSYAITSTANPTAGGTVSGAGTFTHGASCTLTATANTGYTFSNWTKNGTVVSSNPSYTFTVTAAGAYVANFTINSYNVTATANPTEGGIVTVGSSKDRDDLVYDFEDGIQGWTTIKGTTGDSPNNWHHNTTHVSYSSGTAHDWSSFGHNSSSGFMISESYISATSSSGTAYGAVTPDNYLVSPQVRLGGSISFYAGARNTSYCAEKFSVMVSTTDNTNTASFTTVDTWTLSLSSVGYTSSPYTVDLSAYSGMGYVAIRHFDCNDQWVLCVDDITIVEGETQSSDAGNFNYGETCTVIATPNTDYHFVNWTENGTEVSTDAEYTFTVTANRDLVANFSETQPTYYTISVTANPTNGGTVTGAGSFVEGSTVTLTATANEGYDFAGWSDGVMTNPRTVNVTGNATYTANFTLKTYVITALVNPANAGTITGAGTYNHGATATLTATANEGYAFINWTKNDVEVSTDATYSFTVTEAGDYVANFEEVNTNITQISQFTAGWNQWTPNVDVDGATLLTQLEQALGTNAIKIVAQNGKFLSYNTTTNAWSGTLQSIEIGTMYKIYIANSCTVSFEGPAIVPAEHPIFIYPGNNWIGFFGSGNKSVAEAMADYTPAQNDKIVYNNKFSTFNGSTWVGTLTELVPGNGYIYKSNATETKTLFFNSGNK